MKRFVLPVIPCSLVLAALTCTAATRLQATEQPLFAPGQLVVRFAPGIIDLPANPPSYMFRLEDVPIALPGLRVQLQNEGILRFQVFAPGWRELPDPPPTPEDYAPPDLCSFRNWYVLHFPTDLDLRVMSEQLRFLPGIVSVGRSPTLQLSSWPSDPYLECPGVGKGRIPAGVYFGVLHGGSERLRWRILLLH